MISSSALKVMFFMILVYTNFVYTKDGSASDRRAGLTSGNQTACPAKRLFDIMNSRVVMRFTIRCCALLALCAGMLTFALQRGPGGRPDRPTEEDRLPNGKLQSDEILKAEYQANLKDAAELMQLAEQLKLDLEKNETHVLSMATLKKTDDIEKLARRIRTRLRH